MQAQTPDGEVGLRFAYVVACDGVRSGLRELVGVDVDRLHPRATGS